MRGKRRTPPVNSNTTSTDTPWIACTDGSGYREGMSVAAAILCDPATQEEKGLFCAKNEADSYRAELEAILLAYEYVAEKVMRAEKSIGRFSGAVDPGRVELLVYSDCKPAVDTVNNGFHQCSDTFEKYSMRLLCTRRQVDGKCVYVSRNVIRQQRHCDQIASGLRVAVKTFLEAQTDVPVKFLRNTEHTDASHE